MIKTVWVVIQNVNAYNQFGSYLNAVFEKKPSVACLVDVLEIDKSTAAQIVAGNSRKSEDDALWYELVEIELGVSCVWKIGELGSLQK